MATGTIQETTNGRWRIRVDAGRDPATGKRREISETFQGKKKDAQARLREMLDNLDDGGYQGPANRTLGHLLDAWWTAKAAGMSPSTARTARIHIESYLRPQLGPVKLNRLDAATLDAFYGRLLAKGVRGRPLAPLYVKRIHTTLRAILEQGVRWKWLARNPAAAASPPRSCPLVIDPPNTAEVDRLLAAADPALAAYLRLAALAGPRRGEIAGLRRSDLDLDAGAVTFRRSVVHGPDRTVMVQPYPKSRKPRRVSIDPGTVEILRARLAEQRELAMACREGSLDPDPWIFSFSPTGDAPPRPDAFTRGFIRLRDRLQLGSVRLHDLRHYAATTMLTNGVDVRTVAGRLGHANPSTTLNIYAAFLPAADREAANIMERVHAAPAAAEPPPAAAAVRSLRPERAARSGT